MQYLFKFALISSSRMMAVANKPAIVFDAAKINIKKLELRLLTLQKRNK